MEQTQQVLIFCPNCIITDKELTAKIAGLRASTKYTGYYTDSKNFHRWNQEGNNFVMVTKISLKNIFGSCNTTCE